MIPRQAAATILRLSAGFPIVAITGPRQSGKTTLVRATFPDKPYVSLEYPDTRAFADSDPRAFLERYPDGAILDEVQRCPDLFSYLQGIVDEDGRMGLFVLTGSQQFDLRSGITQSLAGRVGMVRLLPFSHRELVSVGISPDEPEKAMFLGYYPPLHDRDIAPGDWHPGYAATYLERDLHQLINVRDLNAFQLFLRMCAARAGQLLNLSSLASDCGITHNTAKAWLSVLEASYIIFLLHPHFRNFNKRLTKTPKLYFYDTGLLCWLLGIQDESQLAAHAMRGPLFETWVMAELMKGRFNRGLPADMYFWRDSTGNEIDILVDRGAVLLPIEVKAGKTVAADFFKALRKWCAFAGNAAGPATLIYAGTDKQTRTDITVLPWYAIADLADTL